MMMLMKVMMMITKFDGDDDGGDNVSWWWWRRWERRRRRRRNKMMMVMIMLMLIKVLYRCTSFWILPTCIGVGFIINTCPYFHSVPWFPLLVHRSVRCLLLVIVYTFKVSMCGPYIWYQNFRQFPGRVLTGTIGLSSLAVSLGFRGQEVSIYA